MGGNSSCPYSSCPAAPACPAWPGKPTVPQNHKGSKMYKSLQAILVCPKARPLSSSMSTAQKTESSGRKKPVYLDTKLLCPQQNMICCSVTPYLQEERQFGPCQYLTHSTGS